MLQALWGFCHLWTLELVDDPILPDSTRVVYASGMAR